MSNKTQLQTNNEKYASLIETLRGKAIPSGGGNVESWTGTITSMTPIQLTVYYTDSTMTPQMQTMDVATMEEGTIEVAANTIVFISGGVCEATSGCTKLGGGFGKYAYQITENNFVITAPTM